MGRTYFNPHKWHQELFGVYTSIVGFAWYVRFYMLAILSLPLLKGIIGKNVWGSFVLSVVPFQAIYILLWKISTYITFHNTASVILEYFEYISIVLIGYCFAKFEIFRYVDRIMRIHKINTVVISILGVLAVFVLRIKWYEKIRLFMPNADIVFVPMFIFCVSELLNAFPYQSSLRLTETIGMHSMNLWFLQSIFFFETDVLQWIVYLPKLSWIIPIWNIVILLPISKGYNVLYKKIRIL